MRLFCHIIIPSLISFSCCPVRVSGSNQAMLSHRATPRRKRRREADSRPEPNWHKQTTSKWRLLFIWWENREGGGAWIEDGGKREKIYLICNCQESIFTCKRASEWERLPRGRNMTAFTRVRMDHHHLQPPPPLCLSPSITLSLSRPCSVFLPLSFLPFFPLLCLTPLTLILFSDSITLHFDNTAA